jgi:hypothetical protein
VRAWRPGIQAQLALLLLMGLGKPLGFTEKFSNAQCQLMGLGKPLGFIEKHSPHIKAS